MYAAQGGFLHHPDVVLNPKFSARDVDRSLCLEGIHGDLMQRQPRSAGFSAELEAVLAADFRGPPIETVHH